MPVVRDIEYTQGVGEQVWDADHEVIERAFVTPRPGGTNLYRKALDFARINFRCMELSHVD